MLDDGDEAFRIGARGQRFFAEAIAHWYGGGPPPSDDTENDDNVAEIAHVARRAWSRSCTRRTSRCAGVDHGHLQHRPRLRHGRLRRRSSSSGSRDLGVDEVMCMIQMGTVPQEVCMETIRQWGENVIPQFR